MKSKRKQLLISSMVMLLVAMLAVTSTTFAWFTTGDKGEVKAFEFTADAASGIQFSADATEWKGEITADDIAKAVYANTNASQAGSRFYAGTTKDDVTTYTARKFVPVSTSGNVTSGAIDFFSATINANGTIDTKAFDNTGDTTGYYLFNLYVNNMGSEDKALVLSGYTVDNGTGKDQKTQLATRIAILDQGNVKKDKAVDAVRTDVVAKLDATTDNETIIEPNSGVHTTDATNILGANGKMDYLGIKAAGTGKTASKNFVTDTTVASTVKTADNFDQEVAQLKGNSITKLTIAVWVEGQDIDCNNDVAEGSVSVTMSFTANKKYKLTFDKNGGEVDAPAAVDSVYSMTAPWEAMTKGQEVLLGWGEDSTNVKYTYGSLIKLSKDTTLYAIYGAKTKLTLNANYEGAEAAATKEIGLQVGIEHEFDEDDAITRAADATNTYAFKGWATSAGATKADYVVGDKITITAATLLYVVWEPTPIAP